MIEVVKIMLDELLDKIQDLELNLEGTNDIVRHV